MTNHHDLTETLERELAVRLGTPLERLRAQRAHCPPLETVRALSGDALPKQVKAELEQHIEQCASCRMLSTDLHDDELTAATPAEAQRIRARLNAGMEEGGKATSATARSQQAAGRSYWVLLLRPALVVAAVVLLFVWIGRMGIREPATPPIAQVPPPAATIPAVLLLEMPEIRMGPATVLLSRGEQSGQQYLKDLAPALEAYRAADYAQAAGQFAALEPKHPKGIEVFFYGGVSRLHAKQNGDAIRLLEKVRALHDPDFDDEASWYLGLAHHRAGDTAAARGQFERLCAGKSEFSSRACEAAKAVSGPAGNTVPR